MLSIPSILVVLAFLTEASHPPVGAAPNSPVHLLAPVPASGEKEVGKAAEEVVSGDGTTCKTVTIENIGQNDAYVKCTWGDSSNTGWIELAAGESHPFICNVEKVEGKCVQSGEEGEETTTLKWTIE